MIDVLIIGAGMYVCGKGTEEYGTILPAVMKAKKDGYVNKILMSATSKKSVINFNKKLKELNVIMGTHIEVDSYPKNDFDCFSYKKALDSLGENACVILAVPDHMHFQIARDAILKNKHILVVKPLVTNIKDAVELIKLKKERNVFGEVEFHKRYDLANLKGKKIIKDKRIGDLLYTIVEYSQRKTIPENVFKEWVDNTNIFQYLGIHYVDMIYFVTGAIPFRVSALGQNKWLINKGINTYDSIEAIIEWKEKDGKTFTSIFALNWIDPNNNSAMSYQSIKYIGTNGRYESDQKNRGNQLITDEKGIEDINPYFNQIYPTEDGNEQFCGYGIDSVYNFLRKCIKINNNQATVEELEQYSANFEQALVSTAVVEAVNNSLKKNGDWEMINIPRLKNYT